MIRLRKLVVTLILAGTAIFVTGCIVPNGYIDPKGRTVGYADVKATEKREKVSIQSRFTTNGKDNKRASQLFEKKLARIIESTKVLSPDDNSVIDLQFILDNHADMSESFGKGFTTGLTLGLAGSQVTDFYTLKVTITRRGKNSTSVSYDHALHSTIGLKAAPEGLTPVPLADAFDQITEDLVLRFLKDYQDGKF